MEGSKTSFITKDQDRLEMELEQGSSGRRKWPSFEVVGHEYSTMRNDWEQKADWSTYNCHDIQTPKSDFQRVHLYPIVLGLRMDHDRFTQVWLLLLNDTRGIHGSWINLDMIWSCFHFELFQSQAIKSLHRFRVPQDSTTIRMQLLGLHFRVEVLLLCETAKARKTETLEKKTSAQKVDRGKAWNAKTSVWAAMKRPHRPLEEVTFGTWWTRWTSYLK